jgi:dTDP-4-dehydrorhamnose reductase
MKVVVTGAAGQLGAAMVKLFQQDTDVVPLTRAHLDLTDGRAVRDTMAATRPAVVINCAAYNHVDEAEAQPVAAFEANAMAVRSMADAAAQLDATFVHYSTDFVFSGTATEPHGEEYPPNPRSVYATSKLLGEWFAADVPRHFVLRVESLFGGPRRRSSVDKIIDGLIAGQPVPVFVDRTVSPSYVEDVARATKALLASAAAPGLYHCVNSGTCTWYELADEASRLLGVRPALVPTRAADLALPAARPLYCALSNAKLADAGITMPPWQDALARYVATLSFTCARR